MVLYAAVLAGAMMLKLVGDFIVRLQESRPTKRDWHTSQLVMDIKRNRRQIQQYLKDHNLTRDDLMNQD